MPNEAPKKTVDQYKHLKNVNRQLHAAMVTEIDKGIQRIYNALQKEAILDNTIIWFSSDNGGECAEAYPKSFKKRINQLTEIFGTPLPVKALEFVRNNIYNSASDNKPLRGGKGSAYEGGVRVPAFIYAPNFLQQRKVNQRITINDVLPSLSIASGFVDFDISNLDGVDQWTFLSGKGNYSSTDYIVHGTYGKEAYYHDDWKLIVSENSNLELYNLFDDPIEMNNVANENKLLVANILSKLKAFPRGKSVHDPIWKTVLDMDEFGGKENRPPWAEIEGVNAGPFHPIYFILPTLLIGVVGLIWYIRLKIRTKRKIN
jgi:arylsulfatase A-like enzyme